MCGMRSACCMRHYTPGDWCSYEGGSGSVTCRLTCSQLTCHSQGKVASALRWVRRRVGHTDPSASVLPTRARTRACSRPPRRGGVQQTPDAPRAKGLGAPQRGRSRHAPAQYRAHTAYARARTHAQRAGGCTLHSRSTAAQVDTAAGSIRERKRAAGGNAIGAHTAHAGTICTLSGRVGQSAGLASEGTHTK